MLWYVTAIVLFGIGKILGKIFKLRTLHYFGLTIGVLLLIIELGLANGLNMFVFL
jgi:hypothetical protein